MEVKCEVRLNGLEEKLVSLGPKLAKRTLRKAVRAAGKLLVNDAKARVPVDTGALRDSIKMKMSTKTGKDGVTSVKATISPMYDKSLTPKGTDSSQNPGIYAKFVEFGTKKMTAKPFLRPAFDANADKVVEKFVETLKADLDSVVKS